MANNVTTFHSELTQVVSVSPLIPKRINKFREEFLEPSLTNNVLTKIIVVLVGASLDEYRHLGLLNFKKIIFLDGAANASAARNIGIQWLYANIAKHSWKNYFVWFADDDCSYPINTNISQEIELNPQAQLFLCRLKDFSKDKIVGKYLSKRSFMSRYSCLLYGAPSIICRLDTCISFNEKIGPGTSYYSAEDTDFLIRAFSELSPNIVISNLYLPHPFEALDKTKIYRYGVGQGFILRKLLLWGYTNVSFGLPLVACFLFLLRPIFGAFFSLVQFKRYFVGLYACRIKGVLYGLFLA